MFLLNGRFRDFLFLFGFILLVFWFVFVFLVGVVGFVFNIFVYRFNKMVFFVLIKW